MKNIYVVYNNGDSSLLHNINFVNFLIYTITKKYIINEILDKGTYIEDKNVIIDYFIWFNDTYGLSIKKICIWDIIQDKLFYTITKYHSDECDEFYRIKNPNLSYFEFSKVDVKGIIIV